MGLYGPHNVVGVSEIIENEPKRITLAIATIDSELFVIEKKVIFLITKNRNYIYY